MNRDTFTRNQALAAMICMQFVEEHHSNYQTALYEDIFEFAQGSFELRDLVLDLAVVLDAIYEEHRDVFMEWGRCYDYEYLYGIMQRLFTAWSTGKVDSPFEYTREELTVIAKNLFTEHLTPERSTANG
ncbi:hypothetical protein [Kineobactrum salinum]|uniref:Uncharacterized protein n=1 Tax=Kineobactrum salinum TaxID=2708301 RepID=A0A6C0UAZ9_9GAMM|nr:hypothetical protein [Kineobactrum salinum]QIB67114.1 hypothetical protein G3T16_18650 [Kineobactrum salinum]